MLADKVIKRLIGIKMIVQNLIARFTNVQRSTYILLAMLSVALLLTYLWGRTLFEEPDEAQRYYQCEKVYVGKIPFACQPGDAILVDADVADKYCTEEVFSRTEDSVYCIYNGIRDDRERKAPLFRRRTFDEIKD